MSLKEEISTLIDLGKELRKEKEHFEILELEEIKVYQYSIAYEKLLSQLRTGGFLSEFDWLSWGRTATKYLEDDKLIEKAKLPLLRKLFTLHVKTEALKDGHLAEIVSSGHLFKLLDRLESLENEK